MESCSEVSPGVQTKMEEGTLSLRAALFLLLITDPANSVLSLGGTLMFIISTQYEEKSLRQN